MPASQTLLASQAAARQPGSRAAGQPGSPATVYNPLSDSDSFRSGFQSLIVLQEATRRGFCNDACDSRLHPTPRSKFPELCSRKQSWLENVASQASLVQLFAYDLLSHIIAHVPSPMLPSCLYIHALTWLCG